VLNCDVTPTGGGGANERAADLMVRWTDSNNYWLVHATAAGGAIQLFQVSGGVLTLRATQNYVFTSGTTYTLTVTASGSTISVAVNGAQQFSYANATSNQTATKVGLWLYAVGSSAACSWDNFVVTPQARLLSDTFTAPDGTALTALGWTAAVGTFQVSGNKALPNSGADND
jgi:hypothetical protein